MYVKHGEARTTLHEIFAEVSQGSVLGPILYLLYTTDLPIHHKTIISIFADDTAVLATHDDPGISHLTNKPAQNRKMAQDMENKSKREQIYPNNFHQQKSDVVTYYTQHNLNTLKRSS